MTGGIPAGGDIIHSSGKGLSTDTSGAWYRNGCQVIGFVRFHSFTLSEMLRQASRSTILPGALELSWIIRAQ